MWGDKERQDLGKADTPSNTGTHVGRQGGKGSPREGEHTFQHRRTRAETMGHNGRQGETRLGKADTPSKKGRQEGRCWMVCPPSRGLVSHSLPFSPIVSPHVRLCLDGVCLCLPLSPPHVCLCWVPEALSPLASHCLACSPHMCAWMVCPPSRGRFWQQGEKRPREGRDTIQHRHTCGETMRDKGRQWETRPRKGPGLRQGFFSFSRNLFPLQCRINSLAICSMLNLEAVISTIFANFGTTSTVLSAFWSKKLMVSQALQSFCFGRNRKFLELAAIWGWFS